MYNYKLQTEFKNNISSDDGVVYLNNEQYESIMLRYEKEDIIDTFVSVFSQNRNKPPIFKESGINVVRDKLIKLKEKNTLPIDPQSINVLMKHDYSFDVGECLGITQLGHYYNDISNHFQIHNRMKCSGYNRISPHDIWNGVGLNDDDWKKLLKGFLSPIFRSVNDRRRITKHEYRFCFRLSSVTYTAAQFKPEVAKTIIEMFSRNGRIIDFSSGWGDRLAGFYASNNGKFYFGTDPNELLHDQYAKQINTYNSIIPKKKAIINNLPAETVDWAKYDDIDLVFTSPPYFTTELYAKGEDWEVNQSWYKYNNYEKWRDGFLFKTIRNILPSLSNDAIFAINIMNITIGKLEYDICGDLYKFMNETGFNYIGYVGMRMKQRPKNVNEDKNKKYMESYYVEPIWIFKR